MNTAVPSSLHTRPRIALAVLALVALVAGLLGVAAPAQAAEASVTGRVFLGSTARPAGVSDVRVLYVSTSTPWFSQQVQTAADGSYSIPSLPVGDYYFFFQVRTGSEFSSEWWNHGTSVSDAAVVQIRGSSTTGPVVTLRPKPLLSGTVSFAGSAPRPATTTVVIRGSQSSLGAENFTATADSSGRWSVPVNLGVYSVEAMPSGTSHQAGPILNSGLRDLVVSSDVAGLDVVLRATGTLSGHVSLGTAGASAGPGAVEIYVDACGSVVSCGSSGAPAAKTDAAGNWSVPGLLTSLYRVQYSYVADKRYQGRGGGFPRVTDAGGAVPLGDVVLSETGSITGQIQVGSPSRPARAGEVEVYTTGNSEPIATSDASGRFTYPQLTAGDYKLRFHAVSGDQADVWWPAAPALELADPIRVTTGPTVADVSMVPAGSISGTLTTTAGRPVVGMSVEALLHGTAARDPLIFSIDSGTDGRFTVGGLPAGSYTLRFADRQMFPGVGVRGGFLGGGPVRSEPTQLTIVAGQRRDVGTTQLFAVTSVEGDLECVGCSGDGFTGVILEYRADAAAAWAPASGGYGGGFSGPLRPGWSAALYPGEYRATAVFRDVATRRVWTATAPAFSVSEGQRLTGIDFTLRSVENAAGGVDFSGDGNSDVIVRTTSGALIEYLGDGGGSWKGSKAIGSGWNGFASVINAGDFSGDGNPDMLARTASGDLYLYRGDGASGWAGAGKKIGSGWNGFDTVFSPGDFDGDGASDVIARTPGGGLYLYRGDGVGSWLGSKAIGSGWNGFSSVFPVGDFDGDGAVDVMARTPSGALYLYRGDGAGGWLGAKQVGSGWGGFTYVGGVGDFDGNGTADVVARDLMGRLWLYRGSGTGSWLLASQIGSGWNGLLFVG